MSLCIKQSGTWRNVTKQCIKYGGTWRNPIFGWIKCGGVWRQYCSPALGSFIEGGFLFYKSSGTFWIATRNSDIHPSYGDNHGVTRSWYCQNDVYTRAQACTGCTGWFIPAENCLSGGYEPYWGCGCPANCTTGPFAFKCRSFWRWGETLWTPAQTNSMFGRTVYLYNGPGHEQAWESKNGQLDKSSSSTVRAWRTVSY